MPALQDRALLVCSGTCEMGLQQGERKVGDGCRVTVVNLLPIPFVCCYCAARSVDERAREVHTASHWTRGVQVNRRVRSHCLVNYTRPGSGK
jgi:hypothetical protein